MKQLLLASYNKGKIEEIGYVFANFGFEIKSLLDFDPEKKNEIEEPAMTLEGNAIIKAMSYGARHKMLTLSDDTGLEVDVLNGRPGVHSSRYADGDRNRWKKLLSELERVPDGKRTARFRCMIAIFDPKSGKIRTCEGKVEGKIASEPKGKNGFGFDPVFFASEAGKTFAELSLEEKTAIDHRGKALEKAKEIIAKEFI